MSNDIIQHNAPAPDNLRTYSMIVYGLYAASLVVGITLLVGVIMAYVKRGEMQGTVFYNHMQYLIKTFWVSLIGFFIGGLTLALAVGGLILIVGRIKAITQVIGYLVAENGIFLLGVPLMTAGTAWFELALLLDVFVAVFVMGIAINHISDSFASIDVARFRSLRD